MGMEWFGVAAFVLIAVSAAYALGRGSRVGSPEDASTAARLDAMELRIDDAVDKISTLYQRIRKRAEWQEPAPRTTEPAPTHNGDHLVVNRKQALRARARSLGLGVTGVSIPR